LAILDVRHLRHGPERAVRLRAVAVDAPKQSDDGTVHHPNSQRKKEYTMAKGLTKTQLVRLMAEKLELTNKQAAAGLELLAETAIKETKKSGEFTIPGIGKLVKAERKARLGRNPQTGETIKIKAKTVVKFRVAKVAKDTIAPAPKPSVKAAAKK